MNFRALWSYLEYDTIDELSHFAPLFRMYVNLFFHQRTVQILVILSTWELFAQILANALYYSVPLPVVLLNAFTVVFEMSFYLALVRLFKGTIFNKTTTTDGTDTADREAREKEKLKTAHREERKHSLHWMASARLVMEHSLTELRALCNGVHARHKRSAPAIQPPLPFYDLLNLSLKFLTRHCNNTATGISLNRPAHTAKLLFILCLLPLYFVAVTYIPLSSPFVLMNEVCDDGEHTRECKNVKLIFYMTFGYATHMIRRYIFCASVILSLMGLAFGAEVAHCLTDSWINRFSPLRRLGSVSEQNQESTAEGEIGRASCRERV
jgi:hypothetical protein